MMKFKLVFLFVFFHISLVSSQTLEKALSLSGKNKGNLINVLEHYENTGEKEKYEAAVFLIKNMPIQKSINYYWVDENRNEIDFSELDYNDFEQAKIALGKLEDSLHIKPQQYFAKDITSITSEFLINNIDIAFEEWKKNPWSSSYSFDVFCEYILPYRSLEEPLEDWRQDYRFLVRQAKNDIEDNTDPTEACVQIINQLKEFSFVTRRPDPIPFLSPKQMMFRREGSCPDLANTALLATRSLGVAVTFDFTPHYAASSNRHFWNTVINNEGKHIPFNSNSVNNKNNFLPYVYNANRKRLGKVFRRTFSIQEASLASKIHELNIPKGFLRNKNVIDVTSEYVTVSDISMAIEKFNHQSIAFLNVFNLGKWRVIDWGEKNDQQMVFKNLGRNLVYLPCIYKSNQKYHLSYPIFLDTEGGQHELKPDHQNIFSATLSRSNEMKTDYIDYNTTEIEEGNTYVLKYWDKGWKELGTSIATDKGVFFQDIPSNSLFRLLPQKPDGFERIFMIEPNTHTIFWF